MLQRQIKGDCATMAPVVKQRDDVIVSFLMILKKAHEHHLGPPLRSVVHAPQVDVCKYLGYRCVLRHNVCMQICKYSSIAR